MASPETGADIVTTIKRTLMLLVVATVVLYALVIGVAAYTYSTSQDNRHALCALRTDLEERVANSRAFLAENPNGIPGISAKVIQDGIANQERTIAALASLSC